MEKITDLVKYDLESTVFHLLAVWSWAIQLTSLSLKFLFYETPTLEGWHKG